MMNIMQDNCKRNKIFLIIAVLVFIGLILVYLAVNNKTPKEITESNNISLALAIFPPGLEGTYYFTVNDKEKTLTITEGSRKNEDLRSQPYITKITNEYSIILTEEEWETIQNLADIVYFEVNEPDNTIITDSWDVAIFYRERIFRNHYFYGMPPAIKALTDEIITILDIELNLHGWA